MTLNNLCDVAHPNPISQEHLAKEKKTLRGKNEETRFHPLFNLLICRVAMNIE